MLDAGMPMLAASTSMPVHSYETIQNKVPYCEVTPTWAIMAPLSMQKRMSVANSLAPRSLHMISIISYKNKFYVNKLLLLSVRI
jgi:hypothetical protein